MNGDVFARQSIQNASGWEDALRNCFRGNITLSFETGKQNRMFISKAAIWALNNPAYVQLLMDVQDLTLLMIGSAYPAPDSIRVCGIGKEPINQYRQEQLARFLEKAGWRKGYRYTLSASRCRSAGSQASALTCGKLSCISLPGFQHSPGNYITVWNYSGAVSKALYFQRSQRSASAGNLHAGM